MALKRNLQIVAEANAGLSPMSASILQIVGTDGEQPNAELSSALRMTPAQVAIRIAQVSAAGDVICRKVTQYKDGKTIERESCLLSAYVPPRTTGRKPGARLATDESADLADSEEDSS